MGEFSFTDATYDEGWNTGLLSFESTTVKFKIANVLFSLGLPLSIAFTANVNLKQ